MPNLQKPWKSAWLLIATLLAGCATEVVPAGSKWTVTAMQTGFYKYGPAQSFGPDLQLPHGTRVTMIQRSFGFSRVMMDTGVTGFVSSDDILPAPPDPEPAKPAPKSRSLFSSGPRHNNDPLPTPGGPLFDTSELPTAPNEHEVKPKFRF